jgi:excisionase family DNA binding protein
MVARNSPFIRTSSRMPALMGTDRASEQLNVPNRTIRRWVKQRNLGLLVAGRRLLTPADLQALEQIRDAVIC